jgi:hypothetical protein
LNKPDIIIPEIRTCVIYDQAFSKGAIFKNESRDEGQSKPEASKGE